MNRNSLISYSQFSPFISDMTMNFHFDKHYFGYVNKYNNLIAGTEFADKTMHDNLIKIAKDIRDGDVKNIAIFNNGAQAWNHYFYWACMRNNVDIQGTTIFNDLKNLIEKDDDKDEMMSLRSRFIEAGIKHFASGWLWIVLVQHDNKQKLDVLLTKNADSPYFYKDDAYSEKYNAHINDCHPVLVCDLWEHAYYLDYQNDRARYLNTFFDNLIHWDAVRRNVNNYGKMCQTAEALPSIKLAGIYTRVNNRDLPALQKNIGETIKKYIQEKIGEKTSNLYDHGYGLYSVYAEYGQTLYDDYTYFVGKRVHSFDGIDPNEFKLLEIPAQNYAKFQIYNGDISERCNYAWKTIWEMTPQELNGQRSMIADFEYYPLKPDSENKGTFEIYIGLV